MMPRTSNLVHADQDGFSVRFNFKRAFVGNALSGGGLVGQRSEVGQASPSPRRLYRCAASAISRPRAIAPA